MQRYEIDRIWSERFPRFFWGDKLDIRYYLAEILSEVSNCTILDIGCAVGILSYIVSQSGLMNEVSGVDLSAERMACATELCGDRVKLVQGNWNELSWEDNTFDIVILSHVVGEPTSRKDKLQLLGEVYRVLKPAGKVYITASNRNYFVYLNKENKYTSGELRMDLAQTGFSGILISGWNPLPNIGWLLPERLSRRISIKIRSMMLLGSHPKIVHVIPGMYPLLRYCLKKGILVDKCKYLYAEALKGRC